MLSRVRVPGDADMTRRRLGHWLTTLAAGAVISVAAFGAPWAIEGRFVGVSDGDRATLVWTSSAWEWRGTTTNISTTRRRRIGSFIETKNKPRRRVRSGCGRMRSRCRRGSGGVDEWIPEHSEMPINRPPTDVRKWTPSPVMNTQMLVIGEIAVATD